MIGCAQCATLKAQITALRREFGQDIPDHDLAAVSHDLRLTPSHARIALTLFHDGGWVSSRALEKRLDMTFDSLKTHVCRMRRIVGDEFVETAHGVGYRLGTEGRAMVREAMG